MGCEWGCLYPIYAAKRSKSDVMAVAQRRSLISAFVSALTCSGTVPLTLQCLSSQKVPFMQTPVSQDDLQKLITALQGFLPGSSGSNKPDMATVKQDLIDYVKKYSIQPVAGVIAMFALVILSIVVFLLW